MAQRLQRKGGAAAATKEWRSTAAATQHTLLTRSKAHEKECVNFMTFLPNVQGSVYFSACAKMTGSKGRPLSMTLFGANEQCGVSK